MSERYQTMAEIERLYPNEWVLLADPTNDANRDVSGGRLLWHHADLDAFNARLQEFRCPRAAVLYTTPAFATDTDIDVISVWTDSTPD